MDEVYSKTIYRSLELRPSSELRLAPAPVVAGAPIINKALQRRKWHTLVPSLTSLALGPARLVETPLQVCQHRIGCSKGERGDRVIGKLRPCWPRGQRQRERGARHQQLTTADRQG